MQWHEIFLWRFSNFRDLSLIGFFPFPDDRVLRVLRFGGLLRAEDKTVIVIHLENPQLLSQYYSRLCTIQHQTHSFYLMAKQIDASLNTFKIAVCWFRMPWEIRHTALSLSIILGRPLFTFSIFETHRHAKVPNFLRIREAFLCKMSFLWLDHFDSQKYSDDCIYFM